MRITKFGHTYICDEMKYDAELGIVCEFLGKMLTGWENSETFPCLNCSRCEEQLIKLLLSKRKKRQYKRLYEELEYAKGRDKQVHEVSVSTNGEAEEPET